MTAGRVALGLGFALVPVIAPAAAAPGVWRLSESHVLGTDANFLVTAHDEATAREAVSAARAEIERLDGVFNSRRPGSELYQLNHSQEMAVSPDLFHVLARAEAWRRRSSGAYHPALGGVLDLWRNAVDAAPDAGALGQAASAAQEPVGLDSDARTVRRPAGATFQLDGMSKGYVVDKALEAGLAAAPEARGLLVDIGGEMRCSGVGPHDGGWRVSVADPALPYLNAPSVADVHLRNQAIATSGQGMRDREIGGERYSTTLDPETGQAITGNIGATVVADTTADADALATALLVLPAKKGVKLAERFGAQARITDAGGLVHATAGWRAVASEPPARLVRIADNPNPNKWIGDWAVEVLYQAPNRQDNRSADFRSPYMAMWITDKAGTPIRTMLLVGQEPKYQKDNYIWWRANAAQAERLIELRSSATAISGRYPLYWPGYDDSWKFVQLGEYVLHVETSQEHGKHTYRTMPLKLGKEGFTVMMPATKEGGGLKITYGKRD